MGDIYSPRNIPYPARDPSLRGPSHDHRQQRCLSHRVSRHSVRPRANSAIVGPVQITSAAAGFDRNIELAVVVAVVAFF